MVLRDTIVALGSAVMAASCNALQRFNSERNAKKGKGLNRPLPHAPQGNVTARAAIGLEAGKRPSRCQKSLIFVIRRVLLFWLAHGNNLELILLNCLTELKHQRIRKAQEHPQLMVLIGTSQGF